MYLEGNNNVIYLLWSYIFTKQEKMVKHIKSEEGVKSVEQTSKAEEKQKDSCSSFFILGLFYAATKLY